MVASADAVHVSESEEIPTDEQVFRLIGISALATVYFGEVYECSCR